VFSLSVSVCVCVCVCVSPRQPLHSDIAADPSLLALPGGDGPGDSEPLIESMGDPVEELREAVEMLNNTARERGRTQSHDQAVRTLLSKVRALHRP